MSDINEVELLKKQLEDAQAKYELLELQMKFADKNTGLWNRKYLEQLIAEDHFDRHNPNFTVVYLGIEHLQRVNLHQGNDAGDKLLAEYAEGIKSSFGKDAECFKMVGTKFCVLLVATPAELSTKLAHYEELAVTLGKVHPDADFTYGVARYENFMGMTIPVLLQEAEYDLLMKEASKDKVAPEEELTHQDMYVGFTEEMSDGYEPADEQPKEKAVGEVANVPKVFNKRLSILMIDDSMVHLRTLKAMLQDRHMLLMSTSGLEGFEIAKAKIPDLILLDYNMPGFNGHRILKLLKESVITQNIPVVFVSGVNDKMAIKEVAELKPAAYLLKPVTKEDIEGVINRLFG